MKSNPCKLCGSIWHTKAFCQHKPRKPIRQVSDKQADYKLWLEDVARPYLIERDGNNCSCCHRPAKSGEKLDIEHTLGVGSHASLKKDLDNLTLMCRFPCHRNKTDHLPCSHELLYC